MANNVKMEGLEELGRTLEMFTQAVQRRTVRNATRAGARVYRDGMKARAPKDSGDLEKKITLKDYPMRREGDYKALIGVKYTGKVAASSRRPGKAPSSEDPAVYAVFDEFGRPNQAGHTHQAAHPFVRPTFDQDTGKAEQAFIDSVKADPEVGKFIK